MLRRVLYGPPNWLVTKFSSEDRRMFAFWVIIASMITYPFFGGYVFYASMLSLLGLIPNFSAETPVVHED